MAHKDIKWKSLYVPDLSPALCLARYGPTGERSHILFLRMVKHSSVYDGMLGNTKVSHRDRLYTLSIVGELLISGN